MIKLIAADMDGTLLDSEKRLSPRFFPLLAALRERNVRFVVASGRQYYNLLKYFPDTDEAAFICDNGGIVFEQGMNTFTDEIPAEKLAEAVAYIRTIPGAMPLLSGAGSAYLEDTDEEFLHHAALYYERRTAVPDVLAAARHDRIAKIAVFDKRGAEVNSWPKLTGRFSSSFQVALSGERWTDLMNPGLSKGRALRRYQEANGIAREETAAFGDYLNDLEMMREAGVSYAMANAHPLLAAACTHRAPSNDEDGVVRAVAELFSIPLPGGRA